MAHERRSEPACAGGAVARVQPASEGFDRESVPGLWLVDEERDRAEHLDRLTEDFQWVNDLALAGFTGPRWDLFVEELAKYGIGVMTGWMRTGKIWARCRDRGFGGLPELARPFDREEIEEIVYETVSKALKHFRYDVLLKGRWDYRRGASLRTYFVGQCLIRFANVYRRWWSHEARSGRALLADDPFLNDREPRTRGVDADVTDHVYAVESLRAVRDERVRVAMVMTADGRTQAEIAVALGVSEKTVEKMLYNQRRRQQPWRDQIEGGADGRR